MITPALISIVVPVFNEEDNVEELHRRAAAAMEAAGRPFELIFVNDHSRDRTPEILRRLHAADPRVKAVCFSRNFGHQTAIAAGMRFASGGAIVLMDGDLQDPPEVVPDLLDTMERGGWDVVYAVRRKRKEPLPVRALYHLFYRLLSFTSYVRIPLDSGDFCAMSRRAADHINRIPERNRFIRGLRSWIGFRQTGMEYERAARNAGEAKYTLKSLFKLAFDGIFSFSLLPLRISTYLGLTLSGAGMLYALYVVVLRSMGRFTGLAGWTTLVTAILVLGGVQLVMLGIIGEYLGRIYEEIKGRPQFIVEELLGLEDRRPEDSPPGRPGPPAA